MKAQFISEEARAMINEAFVQLRSRIEFRQDQLEFEQIRIEDHCRATAFDMMCQVRSETRLEMNAMKEEMKGLKDENAALKKKMDRMMKQSLELAKMTVEEVPLGVKVHERLSCGICLIRTPEFGNIVCGHKNLCYFCALQMFHRSTIVICEECKTECEFYHYLGPNIELVENCEPTENSEPTEN